MGDNSRFRARTVIESNEVLGKIETLRKRYFYFDEAYAALTWSLARDCDKVTREVTEKRGQTYNPFVQRRNETKLNDPRAYESSISTTKIPLR
jgi:hypothetical protein